MLKICISTILAFMLVGCTGKIQTNPLPDQSKVNLPRNYKSKFNVGVDKSLLEEFDRYAKFMLTNSNFDENSFVNHDEDVKINKQYDEAINPKPNVVNLWQKGLETADKGTKKESKRWKRF